MVEKKRKKRKQVLSPKSRAQENKEIRQEALRDQLTSMKLIESLDRDLQRLDAIHNGAARAKNALSLSAKRTQIMALKVRVQVTLAKLNKVLPDLKSTDLTGSLAHTHYNPSPTDRQVAAWLNMNLDDYMAQKETGELPPLPDLPPLPERIKRFLGTEH